MNQLTKFLVDSILNEEDDSLDIVALFGGGFKPPTKGHLEVVLQGLKENPEVKQIQILVGSGERNGVTQEEAIKIWEMYKKFIPVSTQIIKVQSPFSYIKTYLQDHQDEDVYIFIGARPDNEEDDKDVAERSKFAKKYSKKAIPVRVQTTGGVSGTMARNAALSGNNEEFITYFPKQLTDSEKKKIIDMVSSVVKERLNENATYSKEIDIQARIMQLTQHMLDKGYNIEPLPKVEFVDGDSENARDFLGKTAYYNPNNQLIVLYTEGRHPKDIVRSFAHEMIHHIQNLEGRLGPITTQNTQEDDHLNDIEAEANLKGTMTFRNWTDSLDESLTKNSNHLYHWTSYSSCKKIIESNKLKSNKSNQFFEYDESRVLPDYKNVVFFTIEDERFADEETSNQCILVVDKSKLSKDYKVISYGDPYEENVVYTNDDSIPILPYLKGVVLMNTLQKSAVKKMVEFLESKGIPYEINNNLEKQVIAKKAKLPSLKKELINKLKLKYPNGFIGYLNRPLVSYQTPEYFKDNPTYSYPNITINKPGEYGGKNKFQIKFKIEPQNLEKYINWFMYSPDSIEDLIDMDNYEGEELWLKGDIPIDTTSLQEANLKGTMTFRNWTDSLQEDGQEISDKNMDDYKKDNNPKGVKDPFGLNAYAQELARGLEEALTIGDKEVERIEKPTNNPEDAIVIYKDGTSEPYLNTVKEGRKKKKDPKKGTGKKPKGSGRRLYTDEDPKDTVGIKFRTKEDIVDTLNKKSFKAKSHARQSQIINLIHQRVRAAYGKAKDPETKSRLKRGLDYITKRKEASKEKTKRLNKLKEQQLDKFGGDAAPETKPKMSFEDRLAYYKDYYTNVSPSTFDIVTEDGTIVIGGLDKPYSKDFNDVEDTRQVPVPVNENVPDAKDDGKAAPYGSGYEKLNEGRYDVLANKLSSIAFEAFKDIHDRGDKEGSFKFRVDHPDDEHDIPSEEFYFDFEGIVEITDDEYNVDGGANAGFDTKGNEITPLLSVKFKIPKNPTKNPSWEDISFDIKDVVRHELEHLTQDGDNEKGGAWHEDPKLRRPSKYMEDDQMLRDLIDLDLLPKADYFRLEKEVDAMLQGLYFKAKKSKRPFKDVVNTYLDIFTSQETITQEEKENILNIWRSRAKALSLPVFEAKYKLGKVMREQEEETVEEQQYTIYCDMDGVLTNFDKQFKELSGGIAPKDYEDKYGKDAFWSLISGGGVGYWVGMPWMPNGKQLWEYISKYNPIILSAPSRENESRLGKRLWVRNNLKPKPKLILASAANKPNYSTRNKILIDDRPDTIANWNAKGGIGILFKSTSQVIEELKKLGL